MFFSSYKFSMCADGLKMSLLTTLLCSLAVITHNSKPTETSNGF